MAAFQPFNIANCIDDSDGLYMEPLIEHAIQCPYCGEIITVLIDCSTSDQEYIEDCQVCCRPINFAVSILGDNDIDVGVSTDDE